MTTQTKPSAGALRAADAVLQWNGTGYIPVTRIELAKLIEQESGLAELLDAAKLAHAGLVKLACLTGDESDQLNAKQCRDAIAKVSNPNADVQQVSPAGRWTEKKGTV